MQLIILCWIMGTFSVESEKLWDLDTVEIYRCRAIAASPAGVVALVDRDAPRLVLFDTKTEKHIDLNAEGEGPGEFKTPFEVCWIDEQGVFALFDSENSRLSKWKPDGTLVSEHPINRTPLAPLFGDANRYFATDDAYGMSTREPKLLALRLGQTGHKMLWKYRLDERREFSTGVNNGNSFRIMYRWDPHLVFGVGSNFLAVGFGERNTLSLLSFDGKPMGRAISFELPRYPVSDRQLAGGVELMPANLQPGLRKGLLKPDGWPYLRRIVVDEHDTIFLIGANPEVGAPHPILALNRDGSSRGKGKIGGMAMVARGKAFYYLTEGGETLALGRVPYQ